MTQDDSRKPDKAKQIADRFIKKDRVHVMTGTMAAYSNLDFGLKIAQRATEYGVDGFSAPQVMAFALELYEEGILPIITLKNKSNCR